MRFKRALTCALWGGVEVFIELTVLIVFVCLGFRGMTKELLIGSVGAAAVVIWRSIVCWKRLDKSPRPFSLWDERRLLTVVRRHKIESIPYPATLVVKPFKDPAFAQKISKVFQKGGWKIETTKLKVPEKYDDGIWLYGPVGALGTLITEAFESALGLKVHIDDDNKKGGWATLSFGE
jgi:hypothetical protein